MATQTMRHAKRLWDYLTSRGSPGPSDAIVVCCSYDLRVCDYACELLRAAVAPVIVFSGDAGNWTRHLWDRPESIVYKERAQANGVSSTRIVIEPGATNIGENIALSREVIPEARAVTFVTKPNTKPRVELTAPIQWPGVRAYTAGPAISFPDEISNVIGLFGLINEMVGDIHRIMEYPKLGYQVEHTLPEEVIASWKQLVQSGFTMHML